MNSLGAGERRGDCICLSELVAIMTLVAPANNRSHKKVNNSQDRALTLGGLESWSTG